MIETMICPECGAQCDRDSVDVGVGVIHGPWGCSCGWSEDDEYNLHKRTPGPDERGGYVDQYGGYHPKGSSMALAYRLAERYPGSEVSERDNA
jgi:hypothetical protein